MAILSYAVVEVLAPYTTKFVSWHTTKEHAEREAERLAQANPHSTYRVEQRVED